MTPTAPVDEKYSTPPHLMDELTDMFNGRGSRPGGYDLRRIAGQAKQEIEHLRSQLTASGERIAELEGLLTDNKSYYAAKYPKGAT